MDESNNAFWNSANVEFYKGDYLEALSHLPAGWDKGLDYRLLIILDGLHENGPEEAFGSKSETWDPEAEAICTIQNIPIELVVAVKYLAEHGPNYDEMLDNAWNVAFEFDPANDPNEEADDTNCPYTECGGYECELDSHAKFCPYTLALKLVEEWRGPLC